MSCEQEFQTVDLIVKSDAETRGVDAFALSLIKAERQIRKLFTYLMFQFPAFTVSDFANFRSALARENWGRFLVLHIYQNGQASPVSGAGYDQNVAQWALTPFDMYWELDCCLSTC